MTAAAFHSRVTRAAEAILLGVEGRVLEALLEGDDGDAVRLGVMRLAGTDEALRLGIMRSFGCPIADAPWTRLLAEFAEWPTESLPRLAEALRQDEDGRRAVMALADRRQGRELFDLFWYGPSSQVWHTAFRADDVPSAKAFVGTWADLVSIRMVPFREGTAVLLDAHGIEYTALEERDRMPVVERQRASA